MHVYGHAVDGFSCDSLLPDPASKLAELKLANMLASVLPTTEEYVLIKSGFAVTTSHPIDRNGLPDVGKCDLVFLVQRDSSIVFLKVRHKSDDALTAPRGGSTVKSLL